METFGWKVEVGVGVEVLVWTVEEAEKIVQRVEGHQQRAGDVGTLIEGILKVLVMIEWAGIQILVEMKREAVGWSLQHLE